MLPYTALFLFGGLRHTEIVRLKWSKIDFEDGTIRVDDSVAKTRHRRLIEMPVLADKPSNLLEWLEPFRVGRKPFTCATPAIWRRHFDAIKRAAGFGTPTVEEPDLKPVGSGHHSAHFNHFPFGRTPNTKGKPRHGPAIHRA